MWISSFRHKWNRDWTLRSSEGNEAPRVAWPITVLDRWLHYGLVLWYTKHLRVTDCLISHCEFAPLVTNAGSQFCFVKSRLITILRRGQIYYYAAQVDFVRCRTNGILIGNTCFRPASQGAPRALAFNGLLINLVSSRYGQLRRLHRVWIVS